MENTEIKGLLLQIDASVELLKQNLKAGDAAVDSFQKHAEEKLSLVDRAFERTGERVHEHVGEIASGFVAFLAVEHLVDLAKEGLEYAASLKEVAEQLGTTTTFLQQFRYAAGQVGIGQEEADKALQKFTKSISQARAGVKEAQGVFAQLGVSGADLKNLTQPELFLKTADGIAKLKNSVTAAAPEVKLFGRAGQELQPLLAQGSEGINRLAQAASDLGIVLSSEQIEKAGLAAHKFQELKTVLQANIAGFVADNADAIYGLAGSLEKLALEAIDFVRETQANFGALGDVFDPFLKSGETVFEKLGIKIVSFHDQIVSILQGFDELANIPIDLNNKAARFDQKYLSWLPGYNTGQVQTRSDTAGTYERAYQRRKAESGEHKAGTGEGEGEGGASYTDPAAAAAARRAAEEAARKAAALALARTERAKKVGDEEARLDDTYLSARAGLTADTVQRAQIERDKLTADTKAKIDQINADAAIAKHKDPTGAAVIDAQAAELRARVERNAAIEADTINQKENIALEQQRFAVANAELDDLRDILGSQSSLATTARERRDIALRQLAAEKEAERKRLQAIVDDEVRKKTNNQHYDQGAIDVAKEQLGSLDRRYAGKEAVAKQGTASPLESYKDQLQKAVGDTNEALQGLEVGAFQGLEDGIVGVISGTETVAGAFKKMATSIIADLARIEIEKAILGGLGGSSDGGILSGIGKFFGGGKASGGPIDATKFYLVGENGPELFAPGLSGSIIPNGALRAPTIAAADLRPASAGRVQVDAHVTVGASPEFDAKMTGVSVRTVAAAAEPIMAGAQARTTKALTRRVMPGGYSG